MECLNCFIGTMQKAVDEHPSYVVCTNCGAMELVYEPMDYQEPVHEVPYQLSENGTIRPQIIGVFGG